MHGKNHVSEIKSCIGLSTSKIAKRLTEEELLGEDENEFRISGTKMPKKQLKNKLEEKIHRWIAAWNEQYGTDIRVNILPTGHPQFYPNRNAVELISSKLGLIKS